VPFDVARADRVCNFFEAILKHSKGEHGDQPFLLLRWQDEILSGIFGEVDDTGHRRARTAYLEVPKKCGKSELAAGIALYVLDQDGEPGCEVYSAASTKDQAALVFRVAAAMVRKSPYLSRKWRVIDSTKTIISRTDPTCFYRAVAADGDSADGINPHCVIVDELHRWKGRKAEELWQILRKSQIARRQPLTVIITTAGVPDESPICWQEHEYVRRMIEGVIEQNPRYFGRIWGAGPDDDPGDPEVWKRVIPSLDANGGFLKAETIREIYEEARSKGESELAEFCRYHLNIWARGAKRYIAPHIWQQNKGALRAIVERPCYAGLDLSSNIDLTGLSLIFPDERDGSIDILPFAWMPDEMIRQRERIDKVPYRQWAKQKHVEVSEGAVIDQSLVKQKLRWAREVFELRDVAYDPWHATQLAVELEAEGFQMVAVRQGFKSLSEPMKLLKQLALDQKIRHAGHPVLGWNVDCLDAKDDGNDNVKPVKPDRQKSDKRIDLAVATIMAISRWSLHPNEGPSPWANAETAVM
jgi:phage terminase large subunit-like protein